MAIKIYLSPSSQFGNKYAYGDTNEAVQCRRIADACQLALERCGFEVRNGQGDTQMEQRIEASNAWGADMHVPIHTNAFNGKVAGTRIFVYAKPSESWNAALKIFDRLAPVTPGTSENIKTYPALYELRKAHKLAVYVECDFHDVPDIARWLIDHVVDVGEAIAHGVADYYGVQWIAPGDRQLYRIQVGAFAKRDNADRFLEQVREHYPDAFIVKY